MVLIKILKRKDASSVMLAVLIALIIWQPLAQETAKPAAKILGLNNSQYLSYAPPGGDWKSMYLYPLVSVILQLIVLEVLCWLWVLGAGLFKKK